MDAFPSRRALVWLLLVAALFVLPRPALAQGVPIQAGQTISGSLDTTDPRMADESHYDLYVYRGRPGDEIEITMRSSAFDAYLAGGSINGSTLIEEDSDDDGAGGTDARLTVSVGADGTYGIRANSLFGNTTGPYTLTLELIGGSAAAGLPINAGQTISGRLQSSAPTLGDGSHYDLYLYRGEPGEEISITMRSRDFDAYLSGGRLEGGSFSMDDSDDDGAGGTDARIVTTVGPSGNYAIRANSLLAGQTGAYTLEVQSSRSSTTAGGARTIRSGESMIARLESGDPRLPDDSHYHEYRYQGRAGERLVVTLASSDFDAFLRFGRVNGTTFELIESDDDGGGGTNAQLAVTLPADGVYAIHANSYAAGELGRYTLSVEDVGGLSGGIPSIALGQTVSARLDSTDPVLSDNSHYKLYTFQGRPGDQVLVTMRSSAFDAYLATGRMVGARFEASQRDDDSAGGTDAQILATIGPDGILAIQANSLSAAQTGQFTLTLAPSSGVAQAPVATAPGRMAIAAGDRVAGALRTSDPMLSDSSHYNLYVYNGNPGDRLRITLVSDEFDAYLRWGRLDGETLRAEAYDDDGAGGTNAQLEVTVDGTGVYALQANSFSAGETGSYTLSIERVGAIAAPTPTASAPTAPAAPAPAPASPATASYQGKWLYQYVDNAYPVYRSLNQRMKQFRALEDVSESLNARYLLPRNVAIRLDECDMINAYFSPRNTEIVFCYELLEMLSDIFSGDLNWTQEEQEAVDGAFRFIMMHEVGHALVHVLDLPITGREEDAADQLAVFSLVENGGEKGAQAAVNGILAIQPDSNVFDDYEFAGEHSLGPVRLYNVLCWIYGSNPGKYRGLVDSGNLPQERAVRCPGEWERMSKAWQRILQPYTVR